MSLMIPHSRARLMTMCVIASLVCVWSLHCHIKEYLPIIMRVFQGATKFEILKNKIANGFAKAERGGIVPLAYHVLCGAPWHANTNPARGSRIGGDPPPSPPHGRFHSDIFCTSVTMLNRFSLSSRRKLHFCPLRHFHAAFYIPRFLKGAGIFFLLCFIVFLCQPI